MTREEQRNKLYNDLLDRCEEFNLKLITEKDSIYSNESYIEIECPIHGREIKKAEYLRHGKRCSKCSEIIRIQKSSYAKNNNKKHEYIEKLNKICKENGFELISTIEDELKYKSKIKIKCPKHGIQEIIMGNFLTRKDCTKCSLEKVYDEYRLDKQEVYDRIKSCGSELLNKEEYINNEIKNLKVTCSLCGNIFTTSLKHFIQHGGQHCKECRRKESIGETKIRKWLENHDIEFIQEYWFKDCRDTNPLPFDFYLLDDNLNYKIIEFDGVQHDKENHYFRGLGNYDYIAKHDCIKNKYCEKNNIKLLRIKYNEINNIDKILSEKLS